MRYLTMEKLNSGMRSAETIYDIYGRILIEKNKLLTDSYIQHLKALGFAGIYVDDKLSSGIEIEPSISRKVKRKALESVHAADPDLCSQVSSNIVEELIQKKRVSMDLMDVRSNSDFTYAHSVNVAVISGVIALGMKLGRETMKQAILAGLLHDLGKMKIPEEILNKPERLNSEEYKVMKTHATLSYEHIMEREDVPENVKQAVLHHHENVDGSGYPDGQLGQNQEVLTKIVHVADVYDALTSKRPYKEPFAPYEALEYLMGGCGSYFDKEVVSALSIYVPLYPKGTEILLSDGNRGLVCENTGIHNMRPVVRLFTGRMVDLAKRDYINVSIVEDNVDHSKSIMENEKLRKKMAERKSIYILEDNVGYQQELSNILSDTYEIHIYSTGKAAINKLAKIKKFPELVIMNTELPDASGIDVARRIKNMSDDVAVLFVSEKADAKTILQVRELGADGYVLRPFQGTYLVAELERILQSSLR